MNSFPCAPHGLFVHRVSLTLDLDYHAQLNEIRTSVELSGRPIHTSRNKQIVSALSHLDGRLGQMGAREYRLEIRKS
jgi:hypothetical protein